MSSSATDSVVPGETAVPVVCFSITADATPCVMPRILALFAKRGLVPTEWRSRVAADDMSIDIRMHGMDSRLADYLGRCLRQIHSIERVLVVAESRADIA